MGRKTKGILAAALVALVLISGLMGDREKGTIIAFVDDAVVIASEDGKKVTRLEDYHIYVPAGEQWSVGDRVEIRDGVFGN